MAGNLVISQINGGAIGVKNAIINGNFQINQRGVSGTVTLAAGAYGHDRFKAGASGCTYTFATSNNVTTLTISAGSLIQVVEGLNLYTDTYTLSWTGTAQGKIGAGSYAGSGVTGSVTGGTNLNIEFNTGTLSLVQLEAGSVASPFERRDYGRELMMCQRYFEKSFPINVAPANGASGTALLTEGGAIRVYASGATVNDGAFVPFKVTKRANPTLTVYGNSSGQWLLTDNTNAGVTVVGGSDSGFSAYQTQSATVIGLRGHYTSSAEL
jgi:hypothetical protein